MRPLQWGPHPPGPVSLSEEEERQQARRQRDGHMRTQDGGDCPQPKERGPEDPALPTPWSWTPSLCNYEKINFCYCSYSSVIFCCGSFLQTTCIHKLEDSDCYSVILHMLIYWFSMNPEKISDGSCGQWQANFKIYIEKSKELIFRQDTLDNLNSTLTIKLLSSK